MSGRCFREWLREGQRGVWREIASGWGLPHGLPETTASVGRAALTAPPALLLRVKALAPEATAGLPREEDTV